MAQMHWRSEGPVRELIGARVLTDGGRERERLDGKECSKEDAS